MSERECLEQLLDECEKMRNKAWRKQEEFTRCLVNDPVASVNTILGAFKAQSAAVAAAQEQIARALESESAVIQNVVVFTNMASGIKMLEVATDILQRALDKEETSE